MHCVQATGTAGNFIQNALQTYRVLKKLLKVTIKKYLDSASIVFIKVALPLLLQIKPKWNYKR